MVPFIDGDDVIGSDVKGVKESPAQECNQLKEILDSFADAYHSKNFNFKFNDLMIKKFKNKINSLFNEEYLRFDIHIWDVFAFSVYCTNKSL